MTDKVALVTGASRGIGRACAVALAKEGYKVAVHYRSKEDEAKSLCAEIGNAMAFRADLGKEEECTDLIKVVKQEMGRIDVLVNNAGQTADQLITFAKPTDFDQLIAVNLKPIFLLTKLVSRQMIKQKSGRIINLSSVVGYTGNPGQSIYAATKGAITAFTKSIAQELAQFGILANTVAPGFIATDMTTVLPDEVKQHILNSVPLKRLGNPEEIANAVAFLASDKASYITGTTLHVNGGMYCS
jgi:3-oxoacyl-[acyl-carrier protein] reductase